MTGRDRAIAFLATIQEDSPEQDSLLWYENATHEERLAAFIRLEIAWRVVSKNLIMQEIVL